MATDPNENTSPDSVDRPEDQLEIPPEKTQTKEPVGDEQAAINREDDPPA